MNNESKIKECFKNIEGFAHEEVIRGNENSYKITSMVIKSYCDDVEELIKKEEAKEK